uniref:Uncharacterized protein n=1 Tax=Faecalibaculum rodentium TaxID=1702221 RepID=A0A140DXN2_9FIRM|nr:hypothetical protein AALO17_22750 [Faecalibaculum rodentium]
MIKGMKTYVNEGMKKFQATCLPVTGYDKSDSHRTCLSDTSPLTIIWMTGMSGDPVNSVQIQF